MRFSLFLSTIGKMVGVKAQVREWKSSTNFHEISRQVQAF
jgi:hypothetical protein